MISVRKTLVLSTLAGLACFWPFLWQVYWPAAWPLDTANHAVGRDFVNLWVGGRLLLEGQWAALFNIDAYLDALRRIFHPMLAQHVWSYPPTSFLLAAPLAMLPYGLALVLWTLAGLALLVWAAQLRLDTGATGRTILLVLLAPATVLNVICGQNGFLTAALLAGGILLLDRRPIAAGVLIGLLSYKPQFGIVIAFVLLALGAWRTIAAAAITALAMALASCLLFGLEPWHAFFVYTLPKQGALLERFQGFFTHMLLSPYAALRQLGARHDLAMGLQVMITLATVVCAMLYVRKTRDPERRLLFVSAATFLATPYALTYDLPIVSLAIARLLVRGRIDALTPLAAVLFGASWALPLAAPTLSLSGVALGPPIALGILLFLSMRLDNSGCMRSDAARSA